MTDNSPLWLKIAVASVPLIAALLAGIFALTNTISRRIERLKNLIEIRKDCPGPVDPAYIDLIILRELGAVISAASREVRWFGRFRVVIYFVVIGTMITGALWVLHIGKSNITGPTFVIFSSLQSLSLIIANYFENKIQQQARLNQNQMQDAQESPQSTDSAD